MCDIVWMSPQSHLSFGGQTPLLLICAAVVGPVLSGNGSVMATGVRAGGLWDRLPMRSSSQADCQSSCHRLDTSNATGSIHSGFRDTSRSGGVVSVVYLEWGQACSAPPPMGDGLTPSLTVTLAHAKF